VRDVMCNVPRHTGPNPIQTDEFVRKNRAFYCKECREKMWNQRGDFEEDEEEERYSGQSANQESVRYKDQGHSDAGPESDLRTGAHSRGMVKRLMEFCGFIGSAAGDFYFGIDDCVGGTEFSKLRVGDHVDFIVSRMPRKEFRGRDGNGNAEEVSLAE
jgi:hypothetical protein